MDKDVRRVLVLAFIGVAIIGATLWMREAGLLRGARARANQEFALSERAHHEGDFEAAMRHMENAVRLDPHFVEAREGLAAMYEQHKGIEAAIAEYQRGIQEDSQNEARYCQRVAEIYFVNRQWEPALQWLRRADSLSRNDLQVQRMIGFCLERQGKWKEAEQHWKLMLQSGANTPEVRRGLERVQRHLNQNIRQGGKGG